MLTQAYTHMCRHTHAHICLLQGMKRRSFSVLFDLSIFIVRLIQSYVKYTPPSTKSLSSLEGKIT